MIPRTLTAGGGNPLPHPTPSPVFGRARGTSAPVLGPKPWSPQLFSRGCALVTVRLMPALLTSGLHSVDADGSRQDRKRCNAHMLLAQIVKPLDPCSLLFVKFRRGSLDLPLQRLVISAELVHFSVKKWGTNHGARQIMVPCPLCRVRELVRQIHRNTDFDVKSQ